MKETSTKNHGKNREKSEQYLEQNAGRKFEKFGDFLFCALSDLTKERNDDGTKKRNEGTFAKTTLLQNRPLNHFLLETSPSGSYNNGIALSGPLG